MDNYIGIFNDRLWHITGKVSEDYKKREKAHDFNRGSMSKRGCMDNYIGTLTTDYGI